MKLLNLLTPNFLKNLDNYFLLHHRLLWITKVHYVLYYGLLTTLAGSALIWAYPLHTDSNLPEVGLILFISILCGLPVLAFWLYKQTLYSIEKNYGNLFPFIEQLRFGIYMVCFAVFVGIPIYFAVLVENKIANLAADEQLAKDAYDLNAGNPYFPSNQNGDVIWEEDKAIIKSWDEQQQFPEMSGGRNYYNFIPFYISYIHQHENYRNDDQSAFRNLFLNTSTDTQRLILIENFITAHNKYSDEKIKMSPTEALAKHHAHEISYNFVYSYKYHISSRLSSISRAKLYPMKADSYFGIVIFSIVFSLATLLTIFQNVKWQDFLAAATSFAIGAIVYGISLAFISAMTSQHGDGIAIIGVVAAFGFFLFQSYQINTLRVFSRFKIFALMFANVMSPFMFILLAVFWSKFVSHNYGATEMTEKFGLIAGMLLHILIFMPFFRKMYLKMRALPRS